MEFKDAGKFIRQKRKALGFKTQKLLIKALKEYDPSVSCSEPYISLIEKGSKSPSIHLLNVLASVLQLSTQEKSELLLIYKRVPSDLEFAVRTNLNESLKKNNLDRFKEAYQNNQDKHSFKDLLRALVIADQSKEALDLLKNAPNFSDDFIELQDRTAQMAYLTGNYEFAIQGFKLALENCPDNADSIRSDLYMSIGVCYFSIGLKNQYSNTGEALEAFLTAMGFLSQSIDLTPKNIFIIDEIARCSYHAADVLDYYRKNGIDLKPLKKHQMLAKWSNNKTIKSNSSWLLKQITHFFNQALIHYQLVLEKPHEGSLPEKALKEAVYFHAYSLCKMKRLEEGLIAINSILILDKNWLTFFLKAGYYLLRFESEKKPEYLSESMAYLKVALEYDPDTVRSVLNMEKDREMKILWEQCPKELNELLKG